jgi:pimeloyl-ACP methyl ester carboxylesterase
MTTKKLAYHLTKSTKSKQALVFLHGFCESKTIWQDFAHALNHTYGYAVLCIDLAGFGESEKWDKPYSIADLAEAVQHTLQALDISQAIMVGHSLGGYVMLAYAEKYSQSLKGICLFNSLIFADTEEKKQNRNKLIESLQVYGTKPFLQTFFHNLFAPANREKYEPAIQQLLTEAQNIHADTLIHTTAAMRDRKDQSKLVRELPVPLCLIMGKEDPIISAEQNTNQAQLPTQFPIFTANIPNCGHLAMIEARQAALLALKTFIATCE